MSLSVFCLIANGLVRITTKSYYYQEDIYSYPCTSETCLRIV